MLVRLIMLLFFGGAAYATWRYFYGHPFLRTPLEWRLVSGADARLARAVALRKQMARKLVRAGGNYGAGLLREVDSVVESMVALVKAADHAARHGARLDAALAHVQAAHEHVSGPGELRFRFFHVSCHAGSIRRRYGFGKPGVRGDVGLPELPRSFGVPQGA